MKEERLEGVCHEKTEGVRHEDEKSKMGSRTARNSWEELKSKMGMPMGSQRWEGSLPPTEDLRTNSQELEDGKMGGKLAAD